MTRIQPGPLRPKLKPSETYRPRLGAQNPPLWKSATAEHHAWLAISLPSAACAAASRAIGARNGEQDT